MSKQENKALVPKLRFPEFQDAGEWIQFELGNCLSRHPEYGINAPAVPYTKNLPTYLRITDISEDGNIRQNQKVSVAKKVTDENYLCNGDIVLARTGASVGKSYKYKNTDGELVFAGFLIRVRPNEKKLNSELLFQYLSTEQYWRWVDFSSTRSGQPGINGNEYALLPVPLPPALKEQQKIADCLSSIDDLLTAQTHKVDALKVHKKGLMQQLFPAEGETVPKLRFPEFRDAGEWRMMILDELVEIVDGDRGANYPKEDDFIKNGFCVFLNAKNVTKRGFEFDTIKFITQDKDKLLRKGKLKRSDVILTTRGSVGHFAFYSKDVPYSDIRINSGMVILRVNTNSITPDFLYSFSRSEVVSSTIQNIAFGNAQQQLTVSEIKKLKMCLPEQSEQQKIADCLSSIDELITAQTQKADALKAHKKGLMQQLFPAVNEVNV